MGIVVEVIAAYLQNNRRLVVPAFGAFMVKESGERIFSDLLSSDDGVLALLLRAKGLTDMEAAVMTDRFIFEVRHNLEQYGYYRLGEIGTLRVEPATKVLKLYPPVQGELPKQKPYVPQPLAETENEKRKTENEEQKTIATTIPTTPKKSVSVAKPRKKFDFVMIVAVVILLVALAAIGYGWYVSNIATVDDDAAMEALRVRPEQIVNE